MSEEWLSELGNEVAAAEQPLYTLPLIPPRAMLRNLPEPLATRYATGLRPLEYTQLQPEQIQGDLLHLPDRVVPIFFFR